MRPRNEVRRLKHRPAESEHLERKSKGVEQTTRKAIHGRAHRIAFFTYTKPIQTFNYNGIIPPRGDRLEHQNVGEIDLPIFYHMVHMRSRLIDL